MITTLFRAVAAVAVLAVLTAVPDRPAVAATIDCDGVLVVVDATALGGDVTAQCAPGAPRTGLDALTAAGLSFTFVPRIPGMVCQIERQPDPCNNAPADAYWSYWHQDPAQPWRYATEGAGTFRPAVGSIEGWVFGSGDAPPAFDPDRQPASPPPAAPAPESSDSGETDTTNDATPDDDSIPEASDEASATDDMVNGSHDDSDDAGGDETADPFDDWPVAPRQLLGAVLVVGGAIALLLSRRNNEKS